MPMFMDERCTHLMNSFVAAISAMMQMHTICTKALVFILRQVSCFDMLEVCLRERPCENISVCTLNASQLLKLGGA